MLEHAKLSGQLAEFPDDAAPRAIFDYLAEIFARFERETQQFLLRIACLPRMSAAVAEGLSGDPKAGRLLLNLALNDYFVSEVAAEEGRVFQLHPLLRFPPEPRRAGPARGARVCAFAPRRVARSPPPDRWRTRIAACGMPRLAGIARLAAGAADDARAGAKRDTRQVAGAASSRGARQRCPPAEGARRLLASPAARAARRLYEQAFEAFRRSGDQGGMIECSAGVIDATVLEFDDLAALDHRIPVLAGLLAERRAAGRDRAPPSRR